MQNQKPTQEHPGLGLAKSLWTETTCGSLVTNQKVVKIDANLPVEAAAEILVQNAISSAPVYNPDTKTYVGMFDYQDLVSYMLVLYKKNELKEEEVAGDDAGSSSVEIREIVRRALSSQPVSVKLVSDLSHRNPFYSVTADTSLLEAMQVFGKGVHRVAVMSNSGDLLGILTQSNVANFLYGKLAQLPIAQKSIGELGIVTRTVKSINAEAQVFAAMSLMNDTGMTSLPMVDHGGRLVGSISLSDIKYVLRGFKYNMLWRSCFQFIAYVRNHQGLVEDKGRDRYPVFDVREKDSLIKAMGKMGATRAHRVWVSTPDTNKLVGVVSLTDALRAVIPKELL